MLHPSSGEVERVGYSRPEFLEITDSVLFVSPLSSPKTRDFSLQLLKHFKIRPCKPENQGDCGNEE